MKKRIVSLLCVLALCLGLLPVTALAAGEIELYVAGQRITESGCYANQDGTWTKVDGTEPASGQFYYDADTVTLTLNEAEIVNYQYVTVGGGFTYPGSVIAFSQSADVSLTIVVSQGTSNITGTGGIRVVSKAGDASLSISGPGSLEVNVDKNDSGISLIGSKNVNLNIDGADVKTLAAYYYGVDLHAGDGFKAAAVVNNGKLTAGGSGGIGIYYRWTNPSDSGTSSLTVSGNAVVDTRDSKILIASQASEVQVSAGSDGNGGIVFNGKSGTVYGDVTLQEDLEIGKDETLTIGKDASLTVPEGTTLTNDGTITVESGGKLEGTPTGEGSVVYKVTGVTLDQTDLTLFTGQSEQLTATVQPANATNKNVTWSTSDATVATVQEGTVTAVAAGTATITVTTADGSHTATCKVTVKDPVYSMATDTAVLSFDSKTEGYADAPAAKTVTITNTGNQPLTLTLAQPASTANFEVGNLSATELPVNGTATFTVQPKTGLAAGNYEETITVTATDGQYNVATNVTVKFAVAQKSVSVSDTSTPDDSVYYTCPACGYHNWTATDAGYRCDHCGYLESVKQLSGYANVKGTYTPGSSGTTTAVTVPQTGDHSSPALWVALLSISGLALCGLVLCRRRQH